MFTLAHLSDPHLAPLPTPHWGELIGKRVTGYINWQRRRRCIHQRAVLDRLTADLKAQCPDHIAVTGDIANIALRSEYAPGGLWLGNLGSPQNVSFVPGNHDAYVRAGLKFADRAWGTFMRSDDGRAEFPYLRRRGPLALIGLTTAVPTAIGMATGRLGGTQIEALSALLNQLKSEDLFRVILIHHPPVSAANWHKRLVDAEALKRVIAAQGAELLLHGHDHLHMLNWLEGPDGARVPVVGVPSASAAPGTTRDAAAYNLYAIDGTPGAWHCGTVSRGVTAHGDVAEQNRMTLLG
jgi:3',5'-cyclic AMP phosphodiesterase CpdA